MRGAHKIITFIRGEKEHNQQSQTTETKTPQFTADQSPPDEDKIRK